MGSLFETFWSAKVSLVLGFFYLVEIYNDIFYMDLHYQIIINRKSEIIGYLHVEEVVVNR